MAQTLGLNKTLNNIQISSQSTWIRVLRRRTTTPTTTPEMTKLLLVFPPSDVTDTSPLHVAPDFGVEHCGEVELHVESRLCHLEVVQIQPEVVVPRRRLPLPAKYQPIKYIKQKRHTGKSTDTHGVLTTTGTKCGTRLVAFNTLFSNCPEDSCSIQYTSR